MEKPNCATGITNCLLHVVEGRRDNLSFLLNPGRLLLLKFYELQQNEWETWSSIVSCPASLSHVGKESRETRIQFWFHMYVTYSNECHYKRWHDHCLILLFTQSVWKVAYWHQRDPWIVESECYACLVVWFVPKRTVVSFQDFFSR